MKTTMQEREAAEKWLIDNHRHHIGTWMLGVVLVTAEYMAEYAKVIQSQNPMLDETRKGIGLGG